MGKCENCGNEYARTFSVRMGNGQEFIFDSFECAARMLAPECSHCGTRILGHGLEENNKMFCCAHCARAEGASSLIDHSVTA